MTSKARPTEETYTAAQLPEMLRSVLIAGLVTTALDAEAAILTSAEGGATDGFAQAHAEVLRTTAEEIRAWHVPKPRPDHLNGGQ